MTEECIHLKDAIEILIRDGHLKQYKKKDTPQEDALESKKVEEENHSPDKSLIYVALPLIHQRICF